MEYEAMTTAEAIKVLAAGDAHRAMKYAIKENYVHSTWADGLTLSWTFEDGSILVVTKGVVSAEVGANR